MATETRISVSVKVAFRDTKDGVESQLMLANDTITQIAEAKGLELDWTAYDARTAIDIEDENKQVLIVTVSTTKMRL